jgi:hypothetical protein
VDGQEVNRQLPGIKEIARNFIVFRHLRRDTGTDTDAVTYYRGPWRNTIPISEGETDEREAFAVEEKESEIYYDAWDRAGNRPGESRVMV